MGRRTVGMRWWQPRSRMRSSTEVAAPPTSRVGATRHHEHRQCGREPHLPTTAPGHGDVGERCRRHCSTWLHVGSGVHVHQRPIPLPLVADVSTMRGCPGAAGQPSSSVRRSRAALQQVAIGPRPVTSRQHRLPTDRALAGDLGLAVNTVAKTYQAQVRQGSRRPRSPRAPSSSPQQRSGVMGQDRHRPPATYAATTARRASPRTLPGPPPRRARW